MLASRLARGMTVIQEGKDMNERIEQIEATLVFITEHKRQHVFALSMTAWSKLSSAARRLEAELAAMVAA
jgi:hypothetical protein